MNLPERDKDGNLPAYAWPGGYPMFYVCKDGGVLCPDCANLPEVRHAQEDRLEDAQWRIVGADVNYEDEALFCDNCNVHIFCAYPEP